MKETSLFATLDMKKAENGLQKRDSVFLKWNAYFITEFTKIFSIFVDAHLYSANHLQE